MLQFYRKYISLMFLLHILNMKSGSCYIHICFISLKYSFHYTHNSQMLQKHSIYKKHTDYSFHIKYTSPDTVYQRIEINRIFIKARTSNYHLLVQLHYYNTLCMHFSLQRYNVYNFPNILSNTPIHYTQTNIRIYY